MRSNNATDVIRPIVLNVPDINSSQFKTIFSVWDDCIEELKPVSYKFNKTDGEITREVYNVLPDLLKREIEPPDLKAWQNFISSITPNKGSIIVQIFEIATLIGIEERETLTSVQSNTITTTARDIGFILVPDQKVSGTSYKWKDFVAIIPIHNKTLQISERFQQAALFFEIAHAIAASDETVSEIEENFLHKFISEQFTLNEFEIECLRELQQVLEIQPPSLSKIGTVLDKTA